MRRARDRVTWRCRGRDLALGRRTLIMGIVNVTPDSFSDGGRYLDPDCAIAHGLKLAEEGAEVLDIGGESTRPGARPVAADEELRRVLPVIRGLSARLGGRTLLSIDTRHAGTAGRALEEGATIVNDVSGLTHDPDMPRVAARSGCGVIVMHMRGTPATMQQAPVYGDVTGDVRAWLDGRLQSLEGMGLDPRTLAVDPGFGFGKTDAHNLELLRSLDRLTELGRPLIAGWSRKSTLGRLTGRDPEDRLAASLAALALAVVAGAHIVRVHDVKESCDAARVADNILPADEERETDRPCSS